MYRACIALVDSTRARLLTYERTSDPGGPHEELTECTDLVNPARRQVPSDLFSDSGGSSGHAGGPGGAGFGFDDHRGAHIDKLDADFARDVGVELGRLLAERPADRLIVCASPRMLGELRKVGNYQRTGLEIDELPRDLVKLTVPQVRDQLAGYGVLPPALARP